MMSFQVEFTRDVLRSLIGQSLREVSYLYSGGSTPPDDAGRLHEVPYGLRLVTSRSVPTTLTWLMEDECEALVAVEGSGEDVGITDLIEAHDVSASTGWRPLLGPVITKAGMSWHRAVPECPPTPWACRLEFGSSGAFVAVLAETRGETLQYQPDNVAVLFERRDAEALHWSGSDHSAWGGDI
ncbi:hypothetical protein AB0F68_35040 [Micromonospora sp. NPDC023966]|uniref:hypothetical protein n=1 Tax=Micromonospora sp. NPDC023966 TaxID=3154699 RepID=UPI0034093CDA